MDTLDIFHEDFNELVNITYNTYWDLPVIYRKSYSKALEQIILDTLENKHYSFDFNLEDLKQQISLFWLRYEKQYRDKKEISNVTLKSYLIKRSIWGIRNWLIKNNSSLRIDPREREVNENPVGFKLNINFLLRGSKNNLLKNLSAYERYIIFLVFKEEKDFVEMSKILQRDRRSIKKHYKNIIEKVKSNNEEAFNKRNSGQE